MCLFCYRKEGGWVWRCAAAGRRLSMRVCPTQLAGVRAGLAWATDHGQRPTPAGASGTSASNLLLAQGLAVCNSPCAFSCRAPAGLHCYLPMYSQVPSRPPLFVPPPIFFQTFIHVRKLAVSRIPPKRHDRRRRSLDDSAAPMAAAAAPRGATTTAPPAPPPPPADGHSAASSQSASDRMVEVASCRDPAPPAGAAHGPAAASGRPAPPIGRCRRAAAAAATAASAAAAAAATAAAAASSSPSSPPPAPPPAPRWRRRRRRLGEAPTLSPPSDVAPSERPPRPARPVAPRAQSMGLWRLRDLRIDLTRAHGRGAPQPSPPGAPLPPASAAHSLSSSATLSPPPAFAPAGGGSPPSQPLP